MSSDSLGTQWTKTLNKHTAKITPHGYSNVRLGGDWRTNTQSNTRRKNVFGSMWASVFMWMALRRGGVVWRGMEYGVSVVRANYNCLLSYDHRERWLSVTVTVSRTSSEMSAFIGVSRQIGLDWSSCTWRAPFQVEILKLTYWQFSCLLLWREERVLVSRSLSA